MIWSAQDIGFERLGKHTRDAHIAQLALRVRRDPAGKEDHRDVPGLWATPLKAVFGLPGV